MRLNARMCSAQRDRAPLAQLLQDSIAAAHDVVDLLFQILPGRREGELAIQQPQYFIFGERVPLDGRGRQDSLGEVKLVELLGYLRAQGNARNLEAFRLALPQQDPQRGRRGPQVN
jgi:hypothetical protein